MADFYRNMVVFGLAPSTQFLRKVLQSFEDRVKKPAVTFPKEVEGPNGAPNLAELAKLRPFNKYFVYRVDRQRHLHASHISLEALLEICRLNKYCNSLMDLLKRSLTQKHLKQLTQRLARQGQGLDHKQQARVTKEVNFSNDQYCKEVRNLWAMLDPQ